MAKIIDWEEIENRFIKGDESLRELAKKCGVSERAIFKHSSARNWPEKRDIYRLQKPSLTVLEGGTKGVRPSPHQLAQSSLPKDLERLESYREFLEDEIEKTPAKSRESLIQALIKLEQVRREWYPPTEQEFFDQITQGLLDRGLTLSDYIAHLREVSGAAG